MLVFRAISLVVNGGGDGVRSADGVFVFLGDFDALKRRECPIASATSVAR